jgi:hypothetical protein
MPQICNSGHQRNCHLPLLPSSPYPLPHSSSHRQLSEDITHSAPSGSPLLSSVDWVGEGSRRPPGGAGEQGRAGHCFFNSLDSQPPNSDPQRVGSTQPYWLLRLPHNPEGVGSIPLSRREAWVRGGLHLVVQTGGEWAGGLDEAG